MQEIVHLYIFTIHIVLLYLQNYQKAGRWWPQSSTAFTMSSKCYVRMQETCMMWGRLKWNPPIWLIYLPCKPIQPPTIDGYYTHYITLYVICPFSVVITTTQHSINILYTVEPHPHMVMRAEREYCHHGRTHIVIHKYTDSETPHHHYPEDQNHSKTHLIPGNI